ncbi:hypothetical protein C8035_v004065 [Colletotrichum spinosum]|uniref:Uncharacterized protein n=1 Tax=Colletotrichum spinosum TaxID=1347390 RepID=A0A4R8QN07_9PEZI|nr:hypothetical protein C8035_v004065 [Colletotrichum spinosum]
MFSTQITRSIQCQVLASPVTVRRPLAKMARQARPGVRFASSEGQKGEAPVPTTSGKVKDAPTLLAILAVGLLMGGGLIHFSARPKNEKASPGQLDQAATQVAGNAR